MSALNALLARFVDGLLYPFREQAPLLGLAVVSLVSAIGMLAIIRATSNHQRIAAVKRALQACVYEIRLFNDDIRAMLGALGEMVRHNLTFLRLSMVPVLWMAVPVSLLVGQLHFHYGYAGLGVGQPVVVKARVKSSSSAVPVLTAPPAIRIETQAVWIPSLREAAWRVVADQPGDYDLMVHVGDDVFTKTVRVSNFVIRRSPVRTDSGFVNQLFYPAEAPLPSDSPIESISVTYPHSDVRVLGQHVDWLIAYFVLATFFMLVLRRWFAVTSYPAPQ